MISSDEEFHEWLLATFREEADEILTDISQGLISLEKAKEEDQAELIEQVFRKTHSLKGAARAVNLKEIESVCQNIENVFSALKREEISSDSGVYDLLHRSITVIYSLLSSNPSSEFISSEIVCALRTSLIEKKKGAVFESDAFPEMIGSNIPPSGCNNVLDISSPYKSHFEPTKSEFSAPESIVSGQETRHELQPGGRGTPGHTPGTDTVRISSHKLDQLIGGSDDLLTTRLFITQRLRELEDMMSTFSLWKWNYSQIEGDLHQIREFTYGIQKSSLPPDILLPLERLIDFFKFDHEFVVSLQHDLSLHIRATDMDRSALEVSTSEISDLIHDAVLLPISTILSPFHKFVRDYSRESGKLVDLKIEGGEIEMDRRILESLKPALMHLIHNSIDHGFETPDVRRARGKPDNGLLLARVTPHSGSKVSIEIIDDGAGIDREMVREIAVEKGVITSKQAPQLTDEEALWLIFRSGLSTCREVSELSGRGLGLAIVDDVVSRLGGDVMISSESLKGTSITIVLPVRMATLRGVVVRAGGQTYVLPLQQVKQVIRADPSLFKYRGSRLVARIDKETVRVVLLTQALGIPDPGPRLTGTAPVPIVTMEYGGRQIACVVDEVIQVQEIVVRPLGSLLKSVKRITGAVILGDGTVAMVLDPIELIQEAFISGRQERPVGKTEREGRRILVVEDSVTSRALLKRILEMAGYLVQTACDGVDAFAKLKEYEFDMVVSDVDMPRMSGFTLTEKIRTDDRYARLGVVLITSLDSVEDREHGRAIGADAYLVKSNFEKDSFLTVISDLLSGKPSSEMEKTG
ncbi:hybrid sensor histidine kinase/response regulator [Methanospirillum lacunae]|uniref:histidine kinase n=1 Tax=Methanospirillum lacunae TaxID=668570 RepID=A0A2V2NC65_9EURY|nr:response regulator [Methanospirillum lacunae]PWR73171.1 hybrid sensor histidine kinase/response regulator [Methanospirillum lacunae]